MAQPTSTGQKIQSLALIVGRVNAIDMAIFSFLVFTLAFTLAEDGIWDDMQTQAQLVAAIQLWTQPEFISNLIIKYTIKRIGDMHNQGLYSYMACATLHKYERDMLELSISFRSEWSRTTIFGFTSLGASVGEAFHL